MSQATELSIARKLVAKAIAQGYKVSVCDGEEYCLKRSVDIIEICKAMQSTDSDMLVFHTFAGDNVGWVSLVWGNGEDVISDYGVNPIIEELVSNL